MLFKYGPDKEIQNDILTFVLTYKMTFLHVYFPLDITLGKYQTR